MIKYAYTVNAHNKCVHTVHCIKVIGVNVVAVKLPLLIAEHLSAQCSCNSSLFPAACLRFERLFNIYQ